ncbi:MAG: alkaline phosphatase [Candidatus Saccharicenans sp.]
MQLKKSQKRIKRKRIKISAGKNLAIFIPFFTALIFLLNLSCSVQSDIIKSESNGQKSQIKHIILFIGDGMQLEHEIAASQYLTGEELSLTWHSSDFYRLPGTTWDVTTYNQFAYQAGRPAYDRNSFDPLLGYNPALGGKWPYPLDKTGQDSYFLTPLPLPPDGKKTKIPATDSASAATAVATGYKTDDGNISWLPSDPREGKLMTLAEMLRAQYGASIGAVSTVPFSHATPAAHVSHNISRSNYAQISEEIIYTTKPEVVISGGYPGPSGTKSFTFITERAYNDLKNGRLADYVFVERESGKNGGKALTNAAREAVASRRKLFGLFGGPGGNFEPPLPENNPGHPQIKRQTEENPLLAEAVQTALKVLSQNPNGFFVMFEQGDIDWANHENNYSWMVGTVWDLSEAVKAAINFVNQPGDAVDWSNTVLIVTADHANSFMRLKRGPDGKPLLKKGHLPKGEPAKLGRPGQYNLVTYSTTGHTNELVMVYVYGQGPGYNYLAKRAGKWYPGTKIIDNTQIFEALSEALNLKLKT